MNWPKNGKLSDDQTGHPVLWWKTVEELGFKLDLPYLPPSWFEKLWGDTKGTPRFRTFGHKDPKNKGSVHFVCTRGGQYFVRYALQIQLQNDGYLVHGLEDEVTQLPMYKRGLVTLLDTYSPHCVEADPRLRLVGRNKLLCGMDFVERPNPEAHVPELVAYVPRLLELYPLPA
jgi:hypothetical protein